MTNQNCTCNGDRPCYHCSVAAPPNPDALYAAWESNNGYTEGIRMDDVERMIRAYFAVAQPEVSSAEELDALPAGSVITTFAHGRCTIVVMKVADNQWASTGQRSVWTTEDVHAGLKGQAATVLHRPAVNDA